ncbi:MAG: sulfur carrier protein ThiS [Bacteroidia bacterium]
MTIFLNGETTDIPQNLNLFELIADKKIQTKGIAIAINQSIIPKSEWDKTLLKENDNLLIITATQGG